MVRPLRDLHSYLKPLNLISFCSYTILLSLFIFTKHLVGDFVSSTMKFPPLSILILLNVALVATHAALPPELYWKSKLPTTPIPKAITDLLHPGWTEDKSTDVTVGKGGVNVDAGKTKPKGGTSVNVGKGGVDVHTGKGKRKRKPVHVGVAKSPFDYSYAATETQLHDNPNVALFFLEKDLHQGTKLNLHFVKSSNSVATFFPRHVADSIPFSSSKLHDILDMFSIKEDSEDAEIVKNSIMECEKPGVKEEEKLCLTSLESMVDFTTSKLGKNVDAFSTQVNKETELQQYEIASGVKKLSGHKAVVCHKQNYPYAVFYCHKTETTKAYSVPLEGADGSRVKAVAVCHTDTSKWNPKHLAFQVLNVQPGTVPVCHFLPQDHVVWVPK